MLRGRIKTFNKDRQFGFIVGEDGNEYFFFIASVRSICNVYAGLIVEFDANENEKGKYADNIYVVNELEKKPAFIQIGEDRIKLSNIKAFGIDKGNAYYIKIYEEIVPELGWKGLFVSPYPTFKWKGEKYPIDKDYIRMGEYYNGQKFNDVFYFFDEEKEEYRWTECKLIRNTNGKITTAKSEDIITKNSIIVEEGRCLRIETYTKETYCYWNHIVDFDINEKVAEIEEYISIK